VTDKTQDVGKQCIVLYILQINHIRWRDRKMIKKTHNIINGWNELFTLVIIIALFLSAGCATGGNFGKTERNRDLDNMFLHYEVLPDHRYYTTGGYDAPAAILAIHTDYILDNSGNLWVPIPNVDQAQMKKWIDTIAPEQNYKGTNSYFAAYILDPNGKRVGAWYSIDPNATVKFIDGNKILVNTPSSGPGLRERGEGRIR
jgi:hypothetical protein